MSMGHTRPSEARPPLLEVLPDSRNRLTRYRTLALATKINDALLQPWGTLDTAPATAAEKTAGFTNLRLIDQKSAEPGSVAGVDPKTPLWLEVYETIPATGELQVGQNTRIKLEDGREAIEANFLQWSTDTFVPGTVGATTAPGDGSAYLQRAEQTNDGALRRIKRTYVYAGTLSTDTTFQNNGLLELRTIVSAKTVPPPPVGFTLIGQPVQNPNGLPVYSYRFARGVGQVESRLSIGNNGALQRVVLTHLTVPGTSVQPTSDPLSGGTIADTQKAERDGHMLWEVTWVKGSGEIGRKVSSDSAGALQRVAITHLTAPGTSSQPTSDPLSGGTLVDTDKNERDGHILWVVTWAKGSGEVSRVSSDDAGGKLQRVVIVHLTASSVSTQPTTDPLAGGVATVTGKRDDAGYRVWEVTWVKGSGEVSRRSIDRFSGLLQRVEITHLTATSVVIQPTTDPLSGGTVLDSGYRDEAGHRVWSVAWIKANTTSLIVFSTRKLNNGKLLIYKRARLAAAPAAPTATISGVVTEIETEQRVEDGYTLYTTTWAEGNGTIESSEEPQPDGSIQYNLTTISDAAVTPAYPGSGTGYLVRLASSDGEGAVISRAVYIKPPPTRTRPVQVEFHKPGLAVAANPPSLVPPVTLDLIGAETITFSTTQTTAVPYRISAWSQLYEAYVRSEDGYEYSRVDQLPGFLGSSSLVGTGTTYRGIAVDSFVVQVSGSNPTTLPTGVKTLAVRCDPFLTALDGTVVWRNSVITADVT